MKSFSEAAPLQGSSFQVASVQGEPLTLKLTQVQDKGSNEIVEQFSLLLKGPLNAPLEQGLYRLQHEILGTVDWMIVPVAKDAEGYLYEAVFNLLKNEQS